MAKKSKKNKKRKKPITDAYGNRVNTGSLTKERAAPSIASIRSPYYPSIANTLTPSTMATLIAGVDNNHNIEFLTLAEEMEERETHYSSVISTRKLAVSGLDIVVEARTDDAKDIEIADFVRKVVEENTGNLAKNALDANAKGYSVNEIMWDRTPGVWVPRGYEWRDPRHFIMDQETGSTIRLRDEEDPSWGIDLEPYRFITHQPTLKSGLSIRSGLARLGMVSYMIKAFTMKDWLAFVEIFGMPLRLGKYEPHADAENKSKLLRAVARIGIDACAIIPESMEIEFIESGSGKASNNDKVFSGLATYIDSQISKAVLGQTMTTDNGSSLSQAQVHNDVRADIQKDDAKQLSAVFRRDLVKPLVDLNFPGPHEHYPILRFHIEEPEDLKEWSDALVPFIDRGLVVEQSAVLDKFKLEEAEKGAPILSPKSSGSAPSAEDDDDMDDDDDDDGDVDDKPADKEPAEGGEDKEEKASVTNPDPSVVQTVMFVKPEYNRARATKWLKKRGYSTSRIMEDENYYRAIQRDPADYRPDSLMTLTVAPGIIFIQGKLKVDMTRDEVIGGLLRKVHAGETLTHAQEHLLEIVLAQAESDTIDRLVNREMKQWASFMNPVVDPILELAEKATSYEEMVAGLKAATKKMNSDEFVDSLATETLKSRGLGDGTDKP